MTAKGGVFWRIGSRQSHWAWRSGDARARITWLSFYKTSHSAEERGMGLPTRRFGIVAEKLATSVLHDFAAGL
jgi:hypothetical protein